MYIVVTDHVRHFRRVEFSRQQKFLRLLYSVIYNVFPRRSVHLTFENRPESARRNSVFFDDFVKVDIIGVMIHRVIDKLRNVVGVIIVCGVV